MKSMAVKKPTLRRKLVGGAKKQKYTKKGKGVVGTAIGRLVSKLATSAASPSVIRGLSKTANFARSAATKSSRLGTRLASKFKSGPVLPSAPTEAALNATYTPSVTSRVLGSIREVARKPTVSRAGAAFLPGFGVGTGALVYDQVMQQKQKLTKPAFEQYLKSNPGARNETNKEKLAEDYQRWKESQGILDGTMYVN